MSVGQAIVDFLNDTGIAAFFQPSRLWVGKCCDDPCLFYPFLSGYKKRI